MCIRDSLRAVLHFGSGFGGLGLLFRRLRAAACREDVYKGQIFSGETVQSAEVSKGFISPAYGSRLSALTQIRTREGDRQNHRQSLTVGTLSLAGTLDGPIKRDKGSYLISARYFFPEAVLAIVDNACLLYTSRCV